MLKLDESIRFLEKESVSILMNVEKNSGTMTKEELESAQERYNKFQESASILRHLKSVLWSLDNTVSLAKEITR